MSELKYLKYTLGIGGPIVFVMRSDEEKPEMPENYYEKEISEVEWFESKEFFSDVA